MSSKADIAEGVKTIISKAKLDTGNDVLKVVTDNGSEYLNQSLKIFYNERGNVHETSATYTPQQNGFIERDIRTVAEAAQTMRLSAKLPKPFWAEAMATSVYLLNRVVNSRNRERTPYELWYNRKPSVNNLHKFGETTIVHVNAPYRDKIDLKGAPMTFVTDGYTEKYNTFRFINLRTHELVISCNAIFLNNSTSAQEQFLSSSPMEGSVEDTVILTVDPLPEQTDNIVERMIESGKHNRNAPTALFFAFLACQSGFSAWAETTLQRMKNVIWMPTTIKTDVGVLEVELDFV